MQNIFITGASSGIGAAFAKYYAAQGARLGLVARRQAVLEALRQSLPNSEQHQIYPVDVNDHAALRVAAAEFDRITGGAHIVIADAGVSRGTITEYHEDLPVFKQVISTNVMGTVATFAPFIEGMKQRNQACRLVGIASVAGIRGLPGSGAYCASKAAVISYCESLRVELRNTPIKVVTICPGYTDTPMTRGNVYPMPFLMPADKFVVLAAATIRRGDSYRVIPWQMAWVAKLLRILPNWAYDLAFANAPQKSRGL